MAEYDTRCPQCGIPGPAGRFSDPHHKPDGITRCVFVRYFDVRFLENDVWEGDFPRDDVREDTDECLPDHYDLEWGLGVIELAVRSITDHGLGSDGGSSGFYNPDGTSITNYRTGERSELSGHLYGFTAREAAEIHERVGRGY